MKIRMSPNIAVRTRGGFEDAVTFYSRVPGFMNRSADPDLAEFDADSVNLYVLEDDEFRGPVLELFVDDLEKARSWLVENGCRVLRWRGRDRTATSRIPSVSAITFGNRRICIREVSW